MRLSNVPLTRTAKMQVTKSRRFGDFRGAPFTSSALAERVVYPERERVVASDHFLLMHINEAYV